MDFHFILSATEELTSKPNVLGTLGVDWKIFLAQLVNFGIVLFIFWKWIVKPLGKTLSDRQERIESGLKNADYMAEEKQKFEIWKIAEMKKVRQEADHVLRTTNDTANQIKQHAITDAQKQADIIVDQAKTSIESQRVQMIKEIKQDVSTLVIAASEKILRAKLDDKKDKELITQSMKDIN